MKDKYQFPTPCGLICGLCHFYQCKGEPSCPGCLEIKGKPFWGECETYTCTKMQKIEHCGLCKDFPCESIINHYDPNNPKGKVEAIFRLGQLTIRAKIGTNEWLKSRKDGSIINFE